MVTVVQNKVEEALQKIAVMTAQLEVVTRELAPSAGRDSLRTRIALLEATMLDLRQKVSDIERAHEGSHVARWQFYAALVTSLFGLATALAALVLK